MTSRPSPAAPFGFSLVEITLTLGIVAFVLVSILGLFSVGIESSRRSADDTIISQIANQVLSDTRTQDLPAPGTGSLEFYYNDKGVTVAQQEAVYKTTLSTQEPGTMIADTGAHLYLIRIEVASVKGSTVVHSSRVIP